MNRPVPPGDCGARGRAARRQRGHPRTMLGAFGLVRGVAEDRAGVGAEIGSARRGRSRAGLKWDAGLLLEIRDLGREPVRAVDPACPELVHCRADPGVLGILQAAHPRRKSSAAVSRASARVLTTATGSFSPRSFSAISIASPRSV